MTLKSLELAGIWRDDHRSCYEYLNPFSRELHCVADELQEAWIASYSAAVDEYLLSQNAAGEKGGDSLKDDLDPLGRTDPRWLEQGVQLFRPTEVSSEFESLEEGWLLESWSLDEMLRGLRFAKSAADLLQLDIKPPTLGELETRIHDYAVETFTVSHALDLLTTIDRRPFDLSKGMNLGLALVRMNSDSVAIGNFESLVESYQEWIVEIRRIVGWLNFVDSRLDYLPNVKAHDQPILDALAKAGGRLTSTELKSLKPIYRKDGAGKHCIDRLAEIGVIQKPTVHGDGVRLTDLGWKCTRAGAPK